MEDREAYQAPRLEVVQFPVEDTVIQESNWSNWHSAGEDPLDPTLD